MKKIILFFGLVAVCAGFSGCAVAGGIFKAGIWVGVLIVLAIIALIIYLVTRSSNKS